METKFPQNSKILSVWRGDKPICVVVFHDFTEYNMEVSIVSQDPRWRDHFDEIADYPFNQLNRDRVTALIRANNHKSLNMIKKLGFTHEGTVREAHDGIDIEIYGLLKREYYGQKRTHTSSTGPDQDANHSG